MARIDLKEAAFRAGVSRSTLNRHIRNNKIPYTIDEKNKRYVDPEDIERFFGDRANRTAGPAPVDPAGDPMRAAPVHGAPVDAGARSGSCAAPVDPAGDPMRDAPVHGAPVDAGARSGSCAAPVDPAGDPMRDAPVHGAPTDAGARSGSCGSGLSEGALLAKLDQMHETLRYSIACIHALNTKRPGLITRVVMAVPIAWCVMSGVYVAGFWAKYGLSETLRYGEISYTALLNQIPGLWPF
ncbi:helix-turn-helix domain-containing protein [Ruegeria sp.]|uniref:helix-turn-helix domain-containing protein n=1 Tax=Ruegeria sp. TaxID=1879320 RepID=UPI003B002A8D